MGGGREEWRGREGAKGEGGGGFGVVMETVTSCTQAAFMPL